MFSLLSIDRSGLVLLGLSVLFTSPLSAGPKKAPPAPMPAVRDATMTIGSVSLSACPEGSSYCGFLTRPLDPTGQVPGTIDIHYEIFPHRDTTQPPLEPVVAVEGGPGYPSTLTRASYLYLFSPLLDRRDLLLVDQRGTGRSAAIHCPEVQQENDITQDAVAACGQALGVRTDLYGSGLAADDLAAILDALQWTRVNLYGDSYGTYLSGTFSARHLDRLRAVILDGAYPVLGLSPWYPEIGNAMRFTFQAACQRSPRCASAGGDALARVTSLVQQVRQTPFSGIAPDGEGVSHEVTVDAVSLAYLGTSDGLYYPLTRQLDPAVRAYTEDGDALPLLRLVSENAVASYAAGAGSPTRQFSAGLFLAVSCTDYPQLYNMTSPVPARVAQRAQSFALQRQTAPDIYAPFTLNEFAAMPLGISVLDLCLRWPAPSATYPPGQPVPPGSSFTPAPVLVLSGDMDTLTPSLQGAKAAQQFSQAQQVIVANSFHVTALGDQDNCAQVLVRNFVQSLTPGDPSCAGQVAEARVFPKFVKRAQDLDPATALPGNEATVADLRAVAAAAYAIGDVMDTWWLNSSGQGIGLRGGTFSYSVRGSVSTFELRGIRWTDDVEVSGALTWEYFYPGQVKATITLGGSGTDAGQLSLTFNNREPLAQAAISGQIGGRKVVASLYAP